MQQNRKAYAGAAVFVVVAGVFQLLSWWLVWDDFTFGPGRIGAKAIANVCGKNVLPFAVALHLENVVRGALLLAVGLLAFGPLVPTPPRRYDASRRAVNISNEFE